MSRNGFNRGSRIGVGGGSGDGIQSINGKVGTAIVLNAQDIPFQPTSEITSNRLQSAIVELSTIKEKKIYKQSTQPSSTSKDDLWINPSSGNMYIRTDIEWKQIGGGNEFVAQPNTPSNINVLWLDTSVSPIQVKYYDATTLSWVTTGLQINDNNTSTLTTWSSSKIQIQLLLIDTKIGDISNLLTTNKNNVVDSINELLNKIEAIEQELYKVKLDNNDIPSYLDGKIDDDTIKIIANKLVAVKLKDMNVTVDEINYLQGLQENVQQKLNSLTSVGNFTGAVDTYADLNIKFTDPKANDMAIVIYDENNNDESSIYMYDGNDWQFVGKFNIELRDFTTDPINLNSEVTGVLDESKIDITIVRESQLIPITDDITQLQNDILNLTNKLNNKAEIDDTLLSSTSKTYSIDKILELLIEKQNKIYIEENEPTNSNNEDLWLKINTSPIEFYIYVDDGITQEWKQIGSSSSLEQQILTFHTFDDFPVNGQENRLYIDLSELKIYIWQNSFSTYTHIGSSKDIVLGVNWIYKSLKNTRTEPINSISIPKYDTSKDTLQVLIEGIEIYDYEKTNETTISFSYEIPTDKDIVIRNFIESDSKTSLTWEEF